MKPASILVLALAATLAGAETPTMRQLMLDLIHPASNDLLLFINRGAAPKDEKDEADWGHIRRSALTLALSESTLRTPNPNPDWTKDAKALADVGAAAYQAAQGKDFRALAALADSLDASCTNCHKQFRPNVFPRKGGPTGGSK